MAEESLKNKTIKGTLWSATDAFLGQGVTFIVGLILARLLSPEEYGLIGIVTIFTTVMLGVVDCGFSNALIRKLKVTNEDYNTLFYFNFVVSLVMYSLLHLSAPLIALFFERPLLVELIRVMGLLLVFQAISIVQYTILSRNVDFKTKAKASAISAVLSGVIGVSMAFMGYGVWSLVAQQLSRQLIVSVCLWYFNRWWPKLLFSVGSLKYMWGFGWKLLISGLLDRVWGQLYQTVVGKCYSPSTLGQYSRSKEYAGIFSNNLTSIVQRVSYPVLAQIQDDKTRMVSGYRKIIKITMFITAIVMISMGAVADPLVYCLIGPQWHQAATFLPLICLSMSLYPLHSINLNMLQVQGRTDIFLYLEIIKKILAIGPICIGIFVDIYLMLICSLVLGMICFFLNSYYTGRSLGYSSWMQLKDVAPSYGVAFSIAIAVYFFKFVPFSYWIVLPIQCLVGVCAFFIICTYFKLPEYIEIKSIVCDYLHSLQHKEVVQKSTCNI